MTRWSRKESGSLVAVAGAAGNVGSEVVRALAAGGHPVRALVRTADQTVPDATETVVVDLNDPRSMTEALADAHAAFLLPGYPHMSESLGRARAAGLARVALLSSPAADLGRSNAVAAYMAESEASVRDSELAWTIVRSCMFASNALQWADQIRAGDEVRVPFPHVRAAVIHAADIGSCLATVLTGDGHDGATYRMSGPEATTPAERIAVLGDVLGRRLRSVGLTDEEALAEMSASMPAKYVEAFFDFYVSGSLDESPVFDTVERLTGRPPRTFREWALDHAERFR